MKMKEMVVMEGMCDKGDDSNGRGSEDQDGVPLNHGSISSRHNFDKRVKQKDCET